MDAREEFLAIAHAALKGDPGLETLKVEWDGSTLIYQVEHGELPTKLAGSEWYSKTPFLREDIIDLLAWTINNRWSRRRLATRDDLAGLRDRFEACLNSCEFDPGWYDLVFSVFALLEDRGGASGWRTTQLKEKFGGLRIYYSSKIGYSRDSDLHRLTSAAEHLSEHICEVCGAPGRLRDGGWIRTLCDEHA